VPLPVPDKWPDANFIAVFTAVISPAMDKLHAIECFVKIVEAGSITAAAAALDVSQPSMVRVLAALERDLGVRLLNRTTRRMSLTDEGRDYYERSRQIVAAVEEAQQSLSARRVTPRGRLRIASSVPFGRMFVAPVVSEFLAEHPEVNIELLLLDRIVDLVEEGMDLAIRVAKLPDSSMIAHPIGEARRVVVASKAFLKTTGRPATPSDLRGQRCVSFTSVASPGHWDFGAGRKQLHVPVKSALITNQIDAAVLACVQSLGFGRFFDYHVLEQIKTGKLVRVLEQFESEPIPASVVYPSSRNQSPNVRRFVSFAMPRLRKRLAGLQQLRNG
jgi:DNA-binding transcriptional LysR family regulator